MKSALVLLSVLLALGGVGYLIASRRGAEAPEPSSTTAETRPKDEASIEGAPRTSEIPLIEEETEEIDPEEERSEAPVIKDREVWDHEEIDHNEEWEESKGEEDQISDKPFDGTATNDAVGLGGGSGGAFGGRRGRVRRLANRRGDRGLSSSSENAEDPAATNAPPQKLAPLASAPRLGKILYDTEDGRKAALEPQALRLVVTVDGPRARTVVDYVFRNPTDRELQGTFFYALPAGATPAGFGMYRGAPGMPGGKRPHGADGLLPPLAGGAGPARDLASAAPALGTNLNWADLQLARVVGNVRAREVYEEVIRRRVDPALLEWSGANTFKARVFPIFPKTFKRVVIAYEQTLPRLDGMLRYHYPLPDRAGLGSIPVEVFIQEEGGTLVRASLGGHEVAAAPQPAGEGWRRCHLDLWSDDETTLDLAIENEGAADVIRAAADPLPGSCFYARLAPDLPEEATARPVKKAIFLLDTSLSSEGPREALAARMLPAILERDPGIESYAVLAFDLHPRWLHGAGAWRKNAPEERRETVAAMNAIFLEGATCLDGVLAEIEARLPELGDPAELGIFLLSDGAITWGQDQLPVLLDRPWISEARWFCYRFGDLAANLDLYDALATGSGSQTVHVLSEAQIDRAATAHRKSPLRLRGVRVEGAEARDLVVAGNPRFLFPGQELEVAGRLPGDATHAILVAEVEVGAEVRSFRHRLGVGGGGLAARAWADLHTRQLLARSDPRLDRLVVALSQAFQLANRAASFLILDTEQDYRRFAIEPEDLALGDIAKSASRASEDDIAKLLGLQLDDVPAAGIAVITALAAGDGDRKPLPPRPGLGLPSAQGDTLFDEEAYRKARARDPLDVQAYESVARLRWAEGDPRGALRALSCLVEMRPADAEAARLVGYACLSLGCFDEARQLFARVRVHRPFEPQSYIEEALAHEAAGFFGPAARSYEIVMTRPFPRHAQPSRTVALRHYRRLLDAVASSAGTSEVERKAAAARLESLPRTGLRHRDGDAARLRVTSHWNTDQVDIDLWVVEPEGTRVYYQNMTSAAGGRLFWDNTTGYGPELYERSGESAGSFRILVDYYGNNSRRFQVPSAVLVVTDLDPADPACFASRRFHLRLLPRSKGTADVATVDL